jgi:predicted DNA-binding antitoxin AbrB/MazE fold protein
VAVEIEAAPWYHLDGMSVTITIAAIYEKGVLRPRQPLELAEGTEVRLTISTAVGERQPVELQSPLCSEIDRLAALGPNWDGYGAGALDRAILDAARRFVAGLATDLAAQPLVVPMSNGALQFEWHKGQRILELEIEDPETIHYLKWDPAEGIQEEDVFALKDVEKANRLIHWFTEVVADV